MSKDKKRQSHRLRLVPGDITLTGQKLELVSGGTPSQDPKSREGKESSFVCFYLKNLGLNGAYVGEICERAEERGLKVCPSNVSLLLEELGMGRSCLYSITWFSAKLQELIETQPCLLESAIYIMTRSTTGKIEVFQVSLRTSGGILLRCCDPGTFWPADSRWIFLRETS